MSKAALQAFESDDDGRTYPGAEFNVLWAVALFTDEKTGWAYPSIDTLARRARISRSTAQRALNNLVRLGKVERLASPGRHPNRYRGVFTCAAADAVNQFNGDPVPNDPNRINGEPVEPGRLRAPTRSKPTPNRFNVDHQYISKHLNKNSARERAQGPAPFGSVLPGAFALGPTAKQPDQKIDHVGTANSRRSQQPNSLTAGPVRQKVPPRGSDTEPPEVFAAKRQSAPDGAVKSNQGAPASDLSTNQAWRLTQAGCSPDQAMRAATGETVRQAADKVLGHPEAKYLVGYLDDGAKPVQAGDHE